MATIASTPSTSSPTKQEKLENADSRVFPPDALVWAKMRGFPPWPARILPVDPAVETPGRQGVVFYGTQETAYIKQSDLSDYFEMRHQYEVPRKHKGFNDGVMEIRVAAGVSKPGDHDPLFSSSTQSSLLAGPPVRVDAVLPSSSGMSQSGVSLSGLNDTSPLMTTSSGRARRPSTRLPADAFISGLQPRNRTNSSSSSKSRSRANSLASTLSPLKSPQRNLQKRARKRVDSESSTNSKRNRLMSITDRFARDVFDGVVNPLATEEFPMLPEIDDTNSHRSSRSRYSSRNLEEYMNTLSGEVNRPSNSNHQPRARSRSNSSGNRTRLISGMSDVFDDLCNAAQTLLPQDVRFLWCCYSSAQDLMSVLRSLPVDPFEDDTERPTTPEMPQGLPPPDTFCSSCGSVCQLYGVKWRCSNKFCLKWNGTYDPFAVNASTNRRSLDTEQSIPSEPKRVVSVTSSAVKKGRGKGNYYELASKIKQEKQEPAEESALKSPRSAVKKPEQKEEDGEEGKKRKRVQIQKGQTPPPKTNGTMQLRRTTGRPKIYKVEKTPPVGENGTRKCSFCGGQVRPQMCGGNKHRWRCVDKKCRKWYGWVRSNEEIPRDLGRKGRWKDAKLIEIRRRDDEVPILGSVPAEMADVKPIKTLNVTPSSPLGQKKLGRPPKIPGKVGRPPKVQKDLQQPDRPKRKYVRRKGLDGTPLHETKRELSPLNARESRFRPTAMERRVRWWQAEKRRADYSPPREIPMEPADAAAVFKMLSQSCRAAAVTRADEPGTVSGTMDLLLDALFASFPPLLSMLSQLPQLNADRDELRRMWEASTVHMPMFQ